jgi:hypothetical protein
MISKPRNNTTISLFSFAIAMILVGILPFQSYLKTFPYPTWWAYSFVFFWAFGLGLIIRWFLTYKIISFEKGKIIVLKKFLGKRQVFDLENLIEKKEEYIKTFGTAYRLFTLRFENGMLEISEQEYNNYENFKKYVEKSVQKPKKRK